MWRELAPSGASNLVKMPGLILNDNVSACNAAMFAEGTTSKAVNAATASLLFAVCLAS